MREWLRILRINQGLTQEDTAKLLLISQQYYSKIERCQGHLTLLMASKISKLFGVPLENIVDMELKEQCSSCVNGV